MVLTHRLDFLKQFYSLFLQLSSIRKLRKLWVIQLTLVSIIFDALFWNRMNWLSQDIVGGDFLSRRCHFFTHFLNWILMRILSLIRISHAHFLNTKWILITKRYTFYVFWLWFMIFSRFLVLKCRCCNVVFLFIGFFFLL